MRQVTVTCWSGIPGSSRGSANSSSIIPEELNKEKFYKMFVDLMALPPPTHRCSYGRNKERSEAT